MFRREEGEGEKGVGRGSIVFLGSCQSRNHACPSLFVLLVGRYLCTLCVWVVGRLCARVTVCFVSCGFDWGCRGHWTAGVPLSCGG